MSETTKPSRCENCRRAEERAELLKKEADLAIEERDEWQASHRWLVENGYAWLGDLESLLEHRAQEGETLMDTLERELEALDALRKQTDGGE